MTMWLITVESTVRLVLEEISYGPVDIDSLEDQDEL
jgi:hypothetical protein